MIGDIVREIIPKDLWNQDAESAIHSCKFGSLDNHCAPEAKFNYFWLLETKSAQWVYTLLIHSGGFY